MVEINIPSQTTLVKDEINSIKTNKDKSERLEFYSAQNEVLLTYVKQILFILYYIVFALMAVALFMKRQQFSLIFVGVMLVLFGIFPYIVDYIATYMYYRWLDIMHYFYAGNAAYLYQPPK
jgi:lipopolysaccharide export LptBFGC system permease protein LptF